MNCPLALVGAKQLLFKSS